MFALLEHTAASDRHWDLLVEVPGNERLPTWRLSSNPLETVGDVPAERIKDHRAYYLDFEGELSGERGVVCRLDRGLATIERLTGDEATFTLEGRLLRGRFEVRRGDSGLVLRRMETPPP